MGKKSRLKRESTNARLVDSSILLVQATRKPTHDELMAELKEAMAAEAEAIRRGQKFERLNNLPLGHPENEHKIAVTFAPIERWLEEQLATGESDALADGTVVFRPRANEEWYPISESFTAVCDTYGLICDFAGVPDQSAPFRQLANKIHYGMPLTEADVLAAQAVIPWMKAMTRTLTPLQFSHYSTAIQIRATLASQPATNPREEKNNERNRATV